MSVRYFTAKPGFLIVEMPGAAHGLTELAEVKLSESSNVLVGAFTTSMAPGSAAFLSGIFIHKLEPTEKSAHPARAHPARAHPGRGMVDGADERLPLPYLHCSVDI
jgi:hypothetical protein